MSQLKMLKSIKPQPIMVAPQELVKTSTMREGELLPLKLEPALENVDPVGWARANREFVSNSLVKHGALLFRGFKVETAELFERFAQTITSNLFHDNGEHPRKSISGGVYTPVFYPPEQKILWHNENSFNHRWPTKIWFCCARPAAQGGETPLVDSRRVFDAMRPEVRRQFIERGVMYVRNYGAGFGLSWQEVFRTESRTEVEKLCRTNFISFEWKDGDGLRTVAVRPAVVKHPMTGEMTWFNQAQHWHVSCLEPQTRHSLLALFEETDLPRNCYYGDGAPIEDSVMEEILDVYRRLEVSFAWQRGDVMVLDNLLTAHARNPFEGERRLWVAMGDMSSFTDVD
jgi:alpha-ketoglutarate-dependent taurine dioxygenase